ncbi:MAG: DUF1570 domain-containing protein [Planctomycetota bacterium]
MSEIIPTRALCFAIAAAASVAAGSCPAQDATAFERALADTRALMARGDWRIAKANLQSLLRRHAGADYARAHRQALVEDAKRCEFFLSHRAPRPGALIHGELVFYRPRTGALQLRYTRPTLADFEVVEQDQANLLLHPAEFTGAYTLQLSGRRHPQRGLRVIVCSEEQAAITVAFGDLAEGASHYTPMGIFRVDGDEAADLAPEAMPPAHGQGPWRAKVVVDAHRIRAFWNGKQVLQAENPTGALGRFGVIDGTFDALSVDGTITPAWLQGKTDAHMQDQLAQFERSFDPRRHLPDWLFRGAAVASPTTAPPGAQRGAQPGAQRGAQPGAQRGAQPGAPPGVQPRPANRSRFYPGDILPQQIEAVNRAAQLTNDDRYRETLQYLDSLSTDGMPRPTRDYLRAICLLALDRAEEALPHAKGAVHADPDFLDGRVLLGRVHEQLRAFADAEQCYREVIAAQPDDGLGYRSLALLLFRRGQPDATREVIREARRQGVPLQHVQELDRLLTMALKGPDWPRVYDYQSTNYHVFSDIDHKTCVLATRTLEQAYSAYKSQLVGIPHTNRRFRAYLFSGEAGYHGYAEKIGAHAREHTAGLYSPVLKQLLVWHLPSHTRLEETIRHEGFHQYLDSVIAQPPTWFNEGLALYYERLARKGGRVEGGVVREDLLAILRENPRRMISLERFLFEGAASFYDQDPDVHYAQAWALVHYLRDSTRANRKLFQDLFRALRQDVPPRDAIELAFRGTNLDRFERRFQTYVRELDGGGPAARPNR